MTASTMSFNLRKVELTPLEQRKLTFDSHAMVTELEGSGENFQNVTASGWTSCLGLVFLSDAGRTWTAWTLMNEDVVAAGFEKRQAELIVSALVTLTTANIDIVYKDMVTKAHQVGSSVYVDTFTERHGRRVHNTRGAWMCVGNSELHRRVT